MPLTPILDQTCQPNSTLLTIKKRVMTRSHEEKGGDAIRLGGLSVWRVGVQWYAFILLFPVVIRLSAVGVDACMRYYEKHQK